MRVSYVVFRVTMEIRVDGHIAPYELVFRIYGPSNSVSIRRLESFTTTGFLPFDPVTVKLDDIQIDKIPGEYIANMAFRKRAANGSLVVRVPVVWRLSPTVGVSGELGERLFPTSIFPLASLASAFDSAVRDALSSPFVAWSVDVEHARFDMLISGAITLEGFVTDRGNESSTPVRIHAELLPDGTATGVCIGEDSRSPVTGVWAARKFKLSTEVQRSAAHSSRFVQFDAMRMSEYHFVESWPESVEAYGPQTQFTLQITRVGQGSSAASEPLDCYQEARLAVLSATTRESAARVLPNALWRQIFVFYDISWFVQVKPRTNDSVLRQVVQPPVVLPGAEPEHATIDGSTGQVDAQEESRVTVATKSQSPDSFQPVDASSSDFRWAAAVWVGIAAVVATWMTVAANEMFGDDDVDLTLLGSGSSLFSNFSRIDHSVPPNAATRHRDGTCVRGSRDSELDFGATYSWHALALAALVNAACATLPRVDPSRLSSLLVASGFLLVRLVNPHQDAFTGSMVDLWCEVTILVATCGWMHSKTVVDAFPAWEGLPQQSRLVSWGCCYVLPFFIALNISTIVSLIQSKMTQSLQWSEIRISGYVDLFIVAATSLVVGELMKLVFAKCFRSYALVTSIGFAFSSPFSRPWSPSPLVFVHTTQCSTSSSSLSLASKQRSQQQRRQFCWEGSSKATPRISANSSVARSPFASSMTSSLSSVPPSSSTSH